MTLITYNGRTTKSVDPGFADKYYSAFPAQSNQAIVNGMTAEQAYSTVAYVFRCVNLRALEVANFPRRIINLNTGNDVSQDSRFDSVTKITSLLYKLESARCLSGAGYGLVNADNVGQDIDLQWVASKSMIPQLDPRTNRLAYFYRGESNPHRIELNKCIYLWNWNPDADNAPGVGESMVSLGPASVLYALDAFAASYFNNGAVKVTVWPIDQATKNEDKKALENFLQRRISGMVNALKNIALRVPDPARWIAPVVIGSDFKDTSADMVTNQKREDIAFSHGMSPNIADGGYKYATADSEYVNFVVGTIVPRVEDTFEKLNEQFYSQLEPPLKIEALPKKHESIQTAFLAQAQAVSALTGGKPVISQNEAREIIDLEPVPGGDWPTQQQLDEQQAREAAANQARMDALNNPANQPTQGDNAGTTADVSTVKAALTEWRKAARENIRQGGAFVLPAPSNVIPNHLAERINAGLTGCKSVGEVNAVFERHWPKGDIGRATSDELVLANELRLAREALERAEK